MVSSVVTPGTPVILSPESSKSALKTEFSLPQKRGRKRPSSRETSEMESALSELIKEHRQSRIELKQRAPDTQESAEDAFFECCAIRSQKLSPTIRSYIQLQITQIFLNAENTNLPPVPITPLPTMYQPEVYPTSMTQEGHGSDIIASALNMVNQYSN